MPAFQRTLPTEYDLGNAQSQSIPDNSVIDSLVLNTRDTLQPGAPDFVILGPGSEVWWIGYSIQINTAIPGDVVPNPLGLLLNVEESFQTAVPYVFGVTQSLLLPVYSGAGWSYSGKYRVEGAAAQIEIGNFTGTVLQNVSWQFWGRSQ